jgi:glycosyltransferase involved in cell wall biosynthesis
VTGTTIDVSVIVAVHNRAATLRHCIDSVLEQAGCDVELIIVDALSDDGTQQIVESYGAVIAAYIREADHGIYDAWNKALAVTRGEWCSFLGADDYYLSRSSIATLLACARGPDEPPVFVYGGILWTGVAENRVIHPAPLDVKKFLRRGRMLPHQGFLHHVEALRAIGGFDASLRIAGDFDAALRLVSHGTVLRCDAVVTCNRRGGISGASDMRRLHRRERFRVARDQRTVVWMMWSYGRSVVAFHAGTAARTLLIRVLGASRGLRTVASLRRLVRNGVLSRPGTGSGLRGQS